MESLRRRTTFLYAVCSLSVLGFLSACGSGDGSPTPGGSGSPSSPSASSSPSNPDVITPPAPQPSGSPSISVVPPPDGRARPTTMRGTVTSTDGGCTVFKDDRTSNRWVLIGETTGLAARTAYEIEGVAMDSMEPACPEGLPFQVTSAKPATPQESGALTVTGTLEDGVEAGCRLLVTDRETFVLRGRADLQNGTRVTVTGTIEDNVMSFCMQGRHLTIESIRTAD